MQIANEKSSKNSTMYIQYIKNLKMLYTVHFDIEKNLIKITYCRCR